MQLICGLTPSACAPLLRFQHLQSHLLALLEKALEGEAVEGTFLRGGASRISDFNRQFLSFCSYDARRELQKRKNLSGDISNQILV